VGNVQRQVRGLGKRHQIIELCQRGLSNHEIGAKIGMAESSVRRHLKKYLKSGTHFPSDLTPEEIRERRAKEIMLAEGHRQRLLERAWHLQQRKPVCIEEEVMLASAECKVSDSLMRISERISALTGADAPKSPPATNVTASLMDLRSLWTMPQAQSVNQLPPAEIPALAAPTEPPGIEHLSGEAKAAAWRKWQAPRRNTDIDLTFEP
jgi:transposase